MARRVERNREGYPPGAVGGGGIGRKAVRTAVLVLLLSCGGSPNPAQNAVSVPTPRAAGELIGTESELAVFSLGEAPNPLPWVEAPLNAPDGPLCEVSQEKISAGGDPVNIRCDLAVENFSDRSSHQLPSSLRLVTWNVRFGAEAETIADELVNHPKIGKADFLLLTEVTRFDLSSKPAGIDQVRQLAETLSMNYVFAVEWNRRELPSKGGEHGTAILSKYPLGNVRVIRHTPGFDWHQHDSRYGGRMTLGVDARVGGTQIALYSSHLDTRPLLPGASEASRARMTAEILADANLPGRPRAQILGGDLNTWTCIPFLSDCTAPPSAELAIQKLLRTGWRDGTNGDNSATDQSLWLGLRLDWLFYRGLTALGGAIAQAEGSDHLPLFMDIAIPDPAFRIPPERVATGREL